MYFSTVCFFLKIWCCIVMTDGRLWPTVALTKLQNTRNKQCYRNNWMNMFNCGLDLYCDGLTSLYDSLLSFAALCSFFIVDFIL